MVVAEGGPSPMTNLQWLQLHHEQVTPTFTHFICCLWHNEIACGTNMIPGGVVYEVKIDRRTGVRIPKETSRNAKELE